MHIFPPWYLKYFHIHKWKCPQINIRTLCLHPPWVKIKPIWYCKLDICSLRPCRASDMVCMMCKYFFSCGGTTISEIMEEMIFSVCGAFICTSLLNLSQLKVKIESYVFSCKTDPDPRLHNSRHSLDTIFEAEDAIRSGLDSHIMSRMHLSTFWPLHIARHIFLWDLSFTNDVLSPHG